jgi:4'-phosphopantetheinyl transferase
MIPVDLWRVSLDVPGNDSPEFLSPDELLRLGRIKHAASRQAFLRARVATRRVIADYLACDPGHIAFEYNVNGKPSIADQVHALSFNVSHSGPHCLIAVTRHGPVGVDIEPVRPGRDFLALARRFYTATENEVLSARSDAGLFYRMWTLKEAHIKARGLKLLDGLDRFECQYENSGRLVCTDRSANPAEYWASRQWDYESVYVAAVVVAGRDIELQEFKLDSA